MQSTTAGRDRILRCRLAYRRHRSDREWIAALVWDRHRRWRRLVWRPPAGYRLLRNSRRKCCHDSIPGPDATFPNDDTHQCSDRNRPCGTERCQARVPGATAKGWDDLSVSRFERSSVIEHEDVRRQESRCVDQRSNRRHAGSLGRVLGGQSTRATLVFRSDLSTLYRELGVSSDTTAKAGGNEKLRVRGLLILDE